PARPNAHPVFGYLPPSDDVPFLSRLGDQPEIRRFGPAQQSQSRRASKVPLFLLLSDGRRHGFAAGGGGGSRSQPHLLFRPFVESVQKRGRVAIHPGGLFRDSDPCSTLRG